MSDLPEPSGSLAEWLRLAVKARFAHKDDRAVREIVLGLIEAGVRATPSTPEPSDFERMSPTEFDAYMARTGFDARIAAAQAERADPSTEHTLDVRLLARALHEASPESHKRQRCRDRHDIRAAAIAAAIARLAESQP